MSTHSSLGLENLARGNRTAIFNNKIKITKKVMDLFWNYKLSKKGIFWSDSVKIDEVNRVLNFVIKSKNQEWKKKSQSVSNILMNYNKNNNKFLKIINYNS